MKARLIDACVCAMLFSAGGAWAAEIVEASGGAAPVAVAAVAVAGAVGNQGPTTPWIHPSMPKRVSARLEEGFELAVERLREVESCGDLFAELGADALETLITGLYFPVDSYRREVEVCGRSSAASSKGAENLAYTTVGGAPTWICRHFARVSTETAAVAVIHEALHHAGLTEKPHDRMAMSSIEITRMVKKACEF
jgi:hypothetical protein